MSDPIPFDEISVTGQRPTPGGFSGGSRAYFELQRRITGAPMNIPANIGPTIGPSGPVTGEEFFQSLLDKPVSKKPPPSEFEKLLEKPVRPREEIVAKAKRPPPPSRLPFALRSFSLSRLLGPLSAATSVADIGARIVDQISQMRLDEVGAIATLTDEPPPDTPLQTIPEEEIEEIVAVAKRRPQRPPPPLPPIRGYRDVETFSDLMARPYIPIDARVPETPPAEIAPPTLPKQKPKTKPKLQPPPPGQVLPGPIFGSSVTMLGPMPSPNPLGTGDPPRFRPTGLTQPRERLVPFRVPSTQAQLSGICPPCPKGTTTRKKRRECWKKLVQERRNPADDKVYKWEQIDCDTGRSLRPRFRFPKFGI